MCDPTLPDDTGGAFLVSMFKITALTVYFVTSEASGLHHMLTHGQATIVNDNIDQACHLPDG